MSSFAVSKEWATFDVGTLHLMRDHKIDVDTFWAMFLGSTWKVKGSGDVVCFFYGRKFVASRNSYGGPHFTLET